MDAFEYVLPKNIEDAAKALAQGGVAKAGGVDLIDRMKEGITRPDRLVSLNGWGKTTDRELKIQGRHSRSYYGFADQLLRSEVRLQQLREESDGAAESPDIREVKIHIAAARRGLQETAHEVEA